MILGALFFPRKVKIHGEGRRKSRQSVIAKGLGIRQVRSVI
jgi:hypothetical protein